MKKLNKDFKNLQELLRTAYSLISPLTYHDDVDRLSPEFVQQDAEKKPGCYLKLGQGADHTLFPICNRYGYKDPKMIKFSLKLAKRFGEKNEKVDMSGIIIKLQKLLSKYDKPIPNTVSQAVLKGKSTKEFNQKMKVNEAGQLKAKEKLEEWGNSDLTKDDKTKKFVQDMYNIKEKALEESMRNPSFLNGGLYGAGKKSGLKYGRRQGVAASVAVGAGALMIKKLYDKFKKEKDPKKKDVIKAKIIKAKKANK